MIKQKNNIQINTKNPIKRTVAFLLVIMLIISSLPISIISASAAPKADIPQSMLNNTALDALAYTGYNVQKILDNGSIYDKNKVGYNIADKTIMSNIGYNDGKKTYKNPQDGIKYSYYNRKTGKYCTVDPTMGTETKNGKPDIETFEERGLVCASFVAYYWLNYLPNVVGIDTMFLRKAVDKSKGAKVKWGTCAVSSWREPLEKLAKQTNSKVTKLASREKEMTEAKWAKLVPGDIVTFDYDQKWENKNNPNETKLNEDVPYAHIALYAGRYDGEVFIYHVGNPNGPEITTLSQVRKGFGEKTSSVNGFYHIDITRPKLQLQKASGNTDWTDKNTNYSLEGAEYAIFDNKTSATTASKGSTKADRRKGSVGTVITDKNGFAEYSPISLNKTYYTVEVSAPPQDGESYSNYILNNTVYEFKKSTNSLVYKATAYEQPRGVELQLQKESSNTTMTDNNDCYSLEGAVYAIFNNRTDADTARKETTETGRQKNAVATMTTDKDGKAVYSKGLPIKDYYVIEVKAPKGYKLNKNTIYTTQATSNINTTTRHWIYKVVEQTTDDNGETIIHEKILEEPKNDPISISITKTDSDGNVISDINDKNFKAKFEIKYYDGYYTTETQLKDITPKAKWVFETKKGKIYYDDLYITTDPKYKSDALYYDDNNQPSIPLGTITIQEVESPPGLKLDDTLYIKQFTGDGHNNTQQDYTYKMEIPNEDISISTTALETTSKSHSTTASGSTSITDTITYSGLLPNTQYTVTGWLVNKSNNTKVVLSGCDAKSVMSTDKKSVTKTFTASETGNGDVQIQYTINSNSLNLAGKTVVAFAEVKNTNGTIIGEHKDINSADQSVKFINRGLSTEIKSAMTKTRYAYPQRFINIFIDNISYYGLEPNTEYTIKTQIAVKDKSESNGYKLLHFLGGLDYFCENTITTSATGSGKKEIQLTIGASTLIGKDNLGLNDYTELAGKSLVVFEKIYDSNGKELTDLSHTDINDKLQTFTFLKPTIKTTLTETTTGVNNTRQAYAREAANFNDAVTMSGLVIGQEYQINGTLIDQNGTTITTKTNTFKASAETQTVNIKYTNINTKNITQVFANVTLICNGYILDTATGEYGDRQYTIATHISRNNDGTVADPQQTLNIVTPSISTKAKDVQTETKYTHQYNHTITDTVTYKNVIPGVPLKLHMSAVTTEGNHDPITIEVADGYQGKPYIPSNGKGQIFIDFTPKEANGAINITACVSDHHNITIYEELYTIDGRLLAEHKDVNDKNQQIVFAPPAITTTATDSVTKTHIGYASDNQIIKDTIKITNLIPGKRYTISGVLMNKADKSKLLINNTEITSTTTFTAGTANQSNGLVTETINVEFKLNSNLLTDNTEAVVYEYLYLGDTATTKPIAREENIDNSNQTVTIITNGKIQIKKYDGLNLKPLKGVQFELYDYTKIPVTVIQNSDGNYTASNNTSNVIMTTDANGEIIIDKLQAGKYYYQEIKGLTGYVTDDKLYELTVEPNEITVVNQLNTPEKGDIIFGKVDKNNKFLANATFDIFTDEAKKKHAVDFYTKTNYSPVTTDETGIVSFNDVPYGTYYIAETNTSNDKILLDDPIIATVSANGTTLTYKGNTLPTIDVESDAATYKLSVIQNDDISINTTAVDSQTNSHTAFIKQKATPTDTITYTIIDTVSYNGLRANDTNYSLRTYVSIIKTNTDGTKTEWAIQNGLTSTTGTPSVSKDYIITNLTADDITNGNKKVSVTFNGNSIKSGDCVVINQYLCYNNDIVAEHISVNRDENGNITGTDENQTVKFTEPSITTKAKDKSTDTNKAHQATKTIITDTVTYADLDTEKTYTLETKLWNKKTQKFVSNIKTATYDTTDAVTSCNIVGATSNQVSTQFKPTNKNGTISISMTFDSTSSGFINADVVVYQYIRYQSNIIHEHADPDDIDQTISFVKPTISTNAIAQQSFYNQKNVYPNGGSVYIRDNVHLENLIIGQTYQVTGKLMVKDNTTNTYTELLGTNGNVITAQSVSFTTTTETYDATVNYTIPSDIMKTLDGKSIVVYEDLTQSNSVIQSSPIVAYHRDINDVNQTITVNTPSIDTVAKDADTQTKYAYTSTKSTITDTVTYTNMMTESGSGGGQYFTTQIADANNNGKIIASKSNSINPSSPNGSIDISITFDSTKLTPDANGKRKAVVFQTLGMTGTKITSHTDLTDEDQTITFLDPSISTIAYIGEQSDSNLTKKSTNASHTTKVGDVVNLKNLLGNKTYTLTGTLMNKATNLPIRVNGKTITAIETFTPDTNIDTIRKEMYFNFDSTSLGNIDIVVFEELRCNGTVIATHNDINDTNQTVKIYGKGKLAVYKINGETNEPLANAEFKLYSDEALTQEVKFGKSYTLGDVNMNGKITLQDAAMIQNYIEGRKTFSELQKILADVNEDGQITSEDYNLIVKATAQLSNLPNKCFVDETSNFNLVTGSNGCIEINELPIGTYYLKEVKAPDRYKLDIETVSVEIKALETTEITIANSPKKGKIPLLKTDSDENPISDVTFKIFTDSECTTPASDFYGNIYPTAITDENGYTEFANVEYGTYYITETRTQAGKQLLSTKITAVVSEDGCKLTMDGKAFSKKTITDSDGNKIEVDIIPNINLAEYPLAGGYNQIIVFALGISIMTIGALSLLIIKKFKKKGTSV